MNTEFRVITPSDLDSGLTQSWRSILSNSKLFENPYFSPEFTQLVGRVRQDVRIVVIENSGRTVGFFPYQRNWLGSGRPVGGPLSDYHGVISEADADWDLSALMRAAHLSTWDFDHLVDVSGNFNSYVTNQAYSPQLDISAGYEAYVENRRLTGSTYIRKTEGLARKLGREVGELQFSLNEPSSEVIDHLLRWKGEQYRRSGINDVFGVKWTRQLIHRIANTQTEEFAGVCSVLRVAGNIVAVHMGMRSRSVLHYWFPGYDPKLAKFSTGIILLLRIAQALSETPVAKIDLGKGDDDYKKRLMTESVPLGEGSIELPSCLAALRRWRRAAEIAAARGGAGVTLRLPLRAIRRFERTRRLR